MRNVNIFKIKYIIALFRWYFKVSKYIKPNKTNISLSRRMGSLCSVHIIYIKCPEYCGPCHSWSTNTIKKLDNLHSLHYVGIQAVAMVQKNITMYKDLNIKSELPI